MATIVLGVVGGVVGGPIGAAIGAAVGQVVDREILFKPKGRDGPRLTDLKLQTSSYGSAIPRVYGTIRVAGCVIWSTDLIETRSTSHKKGQPSVTTYSYAASFAVLLSARAVAGVGRIWADGNLLRGAAGDFKTATGFRLHLGDEDQAADPLIASLEGGGAPACRGCAYAVFENLQLADFGNRIPSLTFELIADPAAVGAGVIAADLAGGVVADGGVSTTIDGCSAYDGSARALVGLLAEAAGARVVPAGDIMTIADTGGATLALDDAGYAAGTDQRGLRQLTAIEAVPRVLSVGYYDAARDYQAGVQAARRPGAGTREDNIEMPAVMTPAAAKTLAQSLLARAEAGRHRRSLRLAAEAAAIAPGIVASIAGEAGRWLVTEAALTGMVAELTLERLPVAAAAASASGGGLPAPDLDIGTTILVAAELPPLGDTLLTAPRLSVIATGTAAGWRRAGLLYSLDDGASWNDGGATAAPAVIGTIVTQPRVAGAVLVDLAGTMTVDLARADMVLADADAAALDRGANLALAGDELLQFGRAESLGGARWRLSQLWRGRRGSEAAAGLQVAGDRFALLQLDAVATIDLPAAILGASVRVMASGVGDTVGPVEVATTLAGTSVVPPAPVALALDDGGTVRWTRRSRLGFRWIDGGDAPLGEEAERYRVTIVAGSGTREVIVDDAACPLLLGEIATGTTITVRQAGTLGESRPATLFLP